MKSCLTLLATAAVLAAAVSASGFALDTATLLSLGSAAGIIGLFVSGYGRTLHPMKAAAARRMRVAHRVSVAHRVPATREFASLVIFNTTCA